MTPAVGILAVVLRFSFRALVGAAISMVGDGLRGADSLAAKNASDNGVQKLATVTVDERGLGRSYLYAEVPGFEILSPFSEQVTQLYTKELQRQRALLSVFIPEIEKPPYEAPQAIFLDDQPPSIGKGNLLVGRSYVLTEAVLRQSLDAIRGVPAQLVTDLARSNRSPISWSHAVSADSVIFYTSIYGFDYARQSGKGRVVATSRGLTFIVPMESLYAHRRPRWPSWFEDGIDALGAGFFSEQTLQISIRLSLTAPPAGLRIEDVFSPRAAANDGQSVQVRRQAACVFVSWALLEDDGSGLREHSRRRDSFWRFANQACEEPVTEEMFVSYFGPDAWSEVLRTWEKRAVSRARSLGLYWPEKTPAFPEVRLRPAKRSELVRIKSEYEWRIGREFADAAPAIAQQCLDQAGRRLRKAYADGERDPQFLAVLALYEADGGSPTEARKYIEEAAAARVVRPRVYYYQARFRLEEERSKLAAPEEKLSLEQVRRVLAPLEIARLQRPALKEVYQTMTELWFQSAVPPAQEDLRALAYGMGQFPRDHALAYNVGLLHARAGASATASDIVAQALRFSPDGPQRKALLQLQTLTRLPPTVGANER